MNMMVRYEIKKVFSKSRNKIVFGALLAVTFIAVFLTVRDVQYVTESGETVKGIAAARHLKEERNVWKRRAQSMRGGFHFLFRKAGEGQSCPCENEGWFRNHFHSLLGSHAPVLCSCFRRIGIRRGRMPGADGIQQLEKHLQYHVSAGFPSFHGWRIYRMPVHPDGRHARVGEMSFDRYCGYDSFRAVLCAHVPWKDCTVFTPHDAFPGSASENQQKPGGHQAVCGRREGDGVPCDYRSTVLCALLRSRACAVWGV